MPKDIIVVGASAGGIEALRVLSEQPCLKSQKSRLDRVIYEASLAVKSFLNTL